MTRQAEVRKLLRMSAEDLQERAGERLIVLDDVSALHWHFAESIAEEIRANNQAGRPTRLILPVGPVGQYPLLAEMVNQQSISLKSCWIFMMDDHCDAAGNALSADHPLSFQRVLYEQFVSRVRPELMAPETQLNFPNRENVAALKERIDSVGGIDTCYGGIGIHGHVAYNEPAPGIRDSDPRVVELNAYTRTINAMRAGIGGNLEGYPRYGITLGMRQVLAARRIRLYCRNGIPLDWANTVLRLALFGEPSDDYPVTHIRHHPDYVIVTDQDTARSPRFIV
jgi:glucosamine-6-phosphate deaminase